MCETGIWSDNNYIVIRTTHPEHSTSQVTRKAVEARDNMLYHHPSPYNVKLAPHIRLFIHRHYLCIPDPTLLPPFVCCIGIQPVGQIGPSCTTPISIYKTIFIRKLRYVNLCPLKVLSYGTQFVMMLMFLLLYWYIQTTYEKVSVNSWIINLMVSDFIVCRLEIMDIILIRISNVLHTCTFSHLYNGTHIYIYIYIYIYIWVSLLTRCHRWPASHRWLAGHRYMYICWLRDTLTSRCPVPITLKINCLKCTECIC